MAISTIELAARAGFQRCYADYHTSGINTVTNYIYLASLFALGFLVFTAIVDTGGHVGLRSACDYAADGIVYLWRT